MSAGKEYHDLILNLLEENSNEVKQLKKDINKELSDLRADVNKQCIEIKEEIHDLKSAKHLIKEHREWKKEVTDVWSPPQMKESKDEIYLQKNKWMVGYGVFVAVQVAWIIYTFFSKQ
jgi:arginine deiminase